MQLLDRTREGPKLTDAGLVLVGHAEAAIARLEEAEHELAAIAGLEGGELRLASFPSASATVLTEAVSMFHRRHPKVRLSVADAEPEQSLPRLRAASSTSRSPSTTRSVPHDAERDLERTPGADRVDAPGAAQATTRSPSARSVPLDELADEDWLCGSRPSTCGEVVLRACRDAGFEPARRLRVRRLQRDAGLHRRRARGHAAPRPGAADPALGPRRPADRPAGARAPRLGRDPGRGLALAGDRGDGRDPGRGRRARSPSATASACGWSPDSGRRAAGRYGAPFVARIAASAMCACQCWSIGLW